MKTVYIDLVGSWKNAKEEADILEIEKIIQSIVEGFKSVFEMSYDLVNEGTLNFTGIKMFNRL